MLLLGTHADSGKGLIEVNKPDILYHTAIIGQSGSGKSYFLSRYIEEIVLITKARIIIIDANGDFAHFYIEEDSKHWDSSFYKPLLSSLHSGTSDTNVGLDSFGAFKSAWSKRTFHVLSAGRRLRITPRNGTLLAPLQIHWKWLEWEQDFLLDVDQTKAAHLYQGINTCIKFANDSANYPQGFSLEDLEDIALDFGTKKLPVGMWPEALILSEADWLSVRVHFRQLRKRFSALWYRGRLQGRTSVPNDLNNYIYNGFRWDAWQVLVAGLSGLDVNHMLLAANVALNQSWTLAVRSWQMARRKQSNELETRELENLTKNFQNFEKDESEIEDEQDTNEQNIFQDDDEFWGDKRVPTFIIIDEAHNFAPEEPSSALQKRVSDRIATIAAEGRKYGLFVVLATQRPQKLRRGLLSECENSSILRLQSRIERSHAAEMLGIPLETVEHVGAYETGSALLQGRWVPAPMKVRFAPARTVLGGGGLDKKYWLNP